MIPVTLAARSLSFWRRVRRMGLGLLLASIVAAAEADGLRAQSIDGFVINVSDIDRAARFYTNVLGFHADAVVHRGDETERTWDRWTGTRRTVTRTLRLRLGREQVDLFQFQRPKGRAIPADSRSTDHWFQHLAIVVRDIDEAYAHLRRWRVAHVSTGPQTLPGWNARAAGIRAFYFKDPDDHVLELIWFPPDKGDPRWQSIGSDLFLGIDHTAIVVSDTDRSIDFYTRHLGLRVAGESENWGVEQEHLNQVFGARVRITSMRAPAGPAIEFLEYLAPPGGRPRPRDARVQDLMSWRIRIRAAPADLAGARGGGAVPGVLDWLMPDPDGHWLEVVP
ncbi:MAG: VOC family protein [Verrucomicrobiales bacterium]|nr:VOC family protein [Verrucomicrobiales bacterium]